MNSTPSNRNRDKHTVYVVERDSVPEQSQDGVVIAKIGREIRFDPAILDTHLYRGWEPVHHDLLLICAAVEFSDRRFARTQQWCRDFHVIVPVLDLEAWQRLEVQETLTDTLRYLTGDDWYFTFVQGNNTVGSQSRQRSLPFGNSKEFVIAYSDGLDSRCVAGIFDRKDTALRVRVSDTKDKIKYGEGPFDLVPFQVKLSRSRDGGVRSRGFKFAAITAVAGHLCGVSGILVPESGQGALGPVLLPLHNVYADYRNYPAFFRKMEGFIATLLGYSVTYKQPRLWYTKGQTISLYLGQAGKKREDLLETRSCWQQRMNVRADGQVNQCGLCAACLLRRMSMHAAGIDESPSVYTFANLSAPHFMDAIERFNGNCQRKLMMQYGSVGVRHLQQLADLAGHPDTALRRYVFDIARATGASEQETGDNLRRLLVQHAEEWNGFILAQGKASFLHCWTKGSRYGRS